MFGLNKDTIVQNIVAKPLQAIGTVVAVLGALAGIIAGIISATPLNQELGTSSSVREEEFTGTDEKPAPELTEKTPLRWGAWQKVGEEGTQVRVFFNGATPTCHGWQAEVSENAVAVTIKLYEGGLPGAPTDCSAEGVRGSLVVDLEKPLGNRLVLQ